MCHPVTNAGTPDAPPAKVAAMLRKIPANGSQMNTHAAPIAATLLLISTVCPAQQADVTFFVIGKHANYRQLTPTQHETIDYSFFSEIFLTEEGDARNASLEFPTGERVVYRDMRRAEGGERDKLLLVSGADRFDNFDKLQARYPDGRYRVSFDTPSGSVGNGELLFQRRPLPAPPAVNLNQADNLNCARFAPGTDTTVRWAPFADGREDPNGILDDLVFVTLTDDSGQRVAHSGRPFSGGRYLTFADSEFTIPGSALLPDASYTLSVEHALLDDTTRLSEVTAFTTRAVTTKVDLLTATATAEACDTASGIPSLDSQVTMFYYNDVDAAAHFYGDILGLEKSIDWDWVKFFKTGPSSNVGLVQQGDGAWHDAKQDNAVMLSLVTRDVDAWYARISRRDDVTLLKPIGSGGGIRSFLLEDPGGYSVEFFQWLDSED